MADIPGLIEGAGEGAGLGYRFLRHVERCRLLVHIVDVAGSEGRDPVKDFEMINKELGKFNPQLAERPMLVVGNKCDLATEEQIASFRDDVQGRGYEFFPIMAAIRYGVDPLLKRIAELLSKLPPVIRYEPDPVPEKPELVQERGAISVVNRGGVYVVEGDWLLNVLRTIDFDDSESLQYFQRVLIHSGVIDALRKAGAGEGDTVSIYDVQFDFVE
jgi:GTP-binding protein